MLMMRLMMSMNVDGIDDAASSDLIRESQQLKDVVLSLRCDFDGDD